MKEQNPNITPSNSIIKAKFHRDCQDGSPNETLFEKLQSIITKEIGNSRNYVIGYACDEFARPRIKGYEKHNGLDVIEVKVIYRTGKLSEATYVEAELIRQHKGIISQNRNKRLEKAKEGSGDHDEYYVYLALD